MTYMGIHPTPLLSLVHNISGIVINLLYLILFDIFRFAVGFEQRLQSRSDSAFKLQRKGELQSQEDGSDRENYLTENSTMSEEKECQRSDQPKNPNAHTPSILHLATCLSLSSLFTYSPVIALAPSPQRSRNRINKVKLT